MRQLKITKQITKRESQSLEQHLQEIGKIALLTSEEEISLAKAIKKGDKKALDRLVNANLKFVISVAKQYQNQGLSLGELISYGHIGLLKAAKRFDETRGFKFISYAVWWIRQSMMQAIAEYARVVRMPLNRISCLSKIVKTRSLLEQKLERQPSIDEIAEELDMSPHEVELTLQVSSKHASIDSPFASGEENTLLDVLEDTREDAPDKGLINESLRRDIYKAMATIDKRERQVLESYFGLEGERTGDNPKEKNRKRDNRKTLEYIGEAINLTRERVRQLKENGITKMKTTLHDKRLRNYLGE